MLVILSAKQHSLLMEILRGHPDLESIEIKQNSDIDQRTRQSICQVLADELTRSGLLPDGEPNPRGMAIEGLIDVLNPQVRDITGAPPK